LFPLRRRTLFFFEATLDWLGDREEGKTKRENSEKSAALPYLYLETIFAVHRALGWKA